MFCKTPAGLDERLAHAEARKGYQIRKSKELDIFGKCRAVIECGPYASEHLNVYRAINGGVSVKWAGVLVYNATSPTGVNACHLDHAWVDALDIALARVKKEQREVTQDTAGLVRQVKGLERDFG